MIADGCRVPQLLTPRDTKLERDFGGFVRGYEPPPKPTNVISGEFAERGQHDWAALCSSKGRSVIRVYWSGLSTCQPSFKSRKDVDLLEDYTFAYSVARATIPQMREMARDSVENGESLHLPPLTHDGLQFVGKAHEFYYCNRGKWLTFIPAED